MSKEMVISANPHETRVAILEEGQLCEYYVEREKEFALVGSIYKGKVTRVLPGMQSAFVEIGLDSDAFLYVSDFLEEIEELDHVVTTDDKAAGIEAAGAPAFSANPSTISGSEPAGAESFPASIGEPLPGESFAPRGESAQSQSPAIARPSAPAGSSDRGRFDNRSRGGRPGGDRGGRGSFGRRGGRGRSSGGSGSSGGRGGERRFGRELPSSKYASSRPSEEHSNEPGSPEGHISTLLPGESLAKFRPSTSGAGSAASSPSVHTEDASAVPFFAPPATAQDSAAQDFGSHESAVHDSPAYESPAREFPVEDESSQEPAPRDSQGRHSPPRDIRSRESSVRENFSPRTPAYRPPASGGGGIEPLPGESLSKWKAHTHLPPEPLDNAPVPDAVRFAPLSPLVPQGAEVDSVTSVDAHVIERGNERVEEPRARETHEFQDSHDSQSEQEERVSHDLHNSRDEFNSHSAQETAGLHSQHESEHHAAEHHEDHPQVDLSEEEAAALAEHIADAQDEVAARDAQSRSFADADAAADAAHAGAHEDRENEGHENNDHEEHEAGADSVEHEETELEEEEAAAEEEGMIAPLSESDIPGSSGAPPSQTDDNALAASEGSQPQTQQPFNARVRGDSRSRMQNPARRGGRDRGGRRDDRGGSRRPQHGHTGGHSHSHGRPQAPRRTQLIADMLKQGQEIIVQIAKEPLGKKGARITSHVALPGRFLVYMPTLDHTGVSRKIASAEERARLRHLVNDAKGTSGGGFIVRTAAASAAPEEVRADVEFLTRTWSEIKARSDTRKAPSLLHRDLNLVERILRDYITPDFGAIWVDTEEEYTKVVDFMSRFQPQLVDRVKLYTKETPVFEEFGIQQEIDKGLRPKVWLKSGGYIVINHTEALVAIDVNTGKFVGKGSNRLEDTIVRTNLEACKEIVRQMRLRDLGGIIIIDFIDMEERRNREKVMAVLEDALRADRAPSKVLRFNEFGLVAITRKRTKQALERTLCQPCPYCTGSGMVKSIPTLCYEIQTEARKMAPELQSGSITLRVHPEIAKALKTREATLIEELERWTKKSIIIQADPTLHWEQYDIY
jgi:Rne/Rng family ribonuclease